MAKLCLRTSAVVARKMQCRVRLLPKRHCRSTLTRRLRVGQQATKAPIFSSRSDFDLIWSDAPRLLTGLGHCVTKLDLLVRHHRSEPDEWQIRIGRTSRPPTAGAGRGEHILSYTRFLVSVWSDEVYKCIGGEKRSGRGEVGHQQRSRREGGSWHFQLPYFVTSARPHKDGRILEGMSRSNKSEIPFNDQSPYHTGVALICKKRPLWRLDRSQVLSIQMMGRDTTYAWSLDQSKRLSRRSVLAFTRLCPDPWRSRKDNACLASTSAAEQRVR